MMNKLLLLVLFGLSANFCNAQNWAPLPFKFNGNDMHYFVDTTENVIYIAGTFTNVNGNPVSLVKWDGTNISYINGPWNRVDGVIIYQHKLYVNAYGYIYRYDTVGWHQTNDGIYRVGGWPFHVLNGRLLVSMFVTDSVTLKERQPVAVLDGNVWKDSIIYDTLWPNNVGLGMTDLTWYKGELYLSGGIPGGIIRYNGKTWSDVNKGIKAESIAQLLVWQGDLYVCGDFTELNGGPGNGIARWDGTSWHRLGGGLLLGNGKTQVQHMAVFKDELYAVGLFCCADGYTYADGVAKWDGKRWCSVNDNFDTWRPYDLACYKGELYIAGGWYSINGDSAFNHLAKYLGGGFDDYCSVPTIVPKYQIEKTSTYPNPVRKALFIRASDIKGVAIFDMQSRKIFDTKDYDLIKGIDVNKFPSGLYLVQTTTAWGSEMSEFIKED